VNKKNILVTGGSGFIGSHLVDLLYSEGHKVFVLDNLSTGVESNENEAVTYLHFDLTSFIDNPIEIQNILAENKIEVVYHLAASADVSLSLKEPESFFNNNLLSSISLVNACSKAKVAKLIFASTSAVFGEPDYLPVNEDHKINPISPYGLTKLGCEQYMKYFSSISNLSFITFRLPNVYGPRQRPDLEGGVVAIFNSLMEKNGEIRIFGDGNQTRDWVHVEDIVLGFYKALDYQKSYDMFLLGSSTTTRLIDLYHSLAKIKKYKKQPIYTEARLGDIKHMVMSHNKIKDALNWQPLIKLEDGLKKLD